MQNQSGKKNLIIAVIIAALIIIGYFVYQSYAAPVDSASLVAVAPTTEATGELAPLLTEVKLLKIDHSIFEDPYFSNSLIDFSIELNPEPVGRDNPFSPINFQSSASQSKVPAVKLPKK